MAEGVLLLALLLRAYHVAPVEGHVPRPVAHLTVRAADGIWLRLSPRDSAAGAETIGPHVAD